MADAMPMHDATTPTALAFAARATRKARRAALAVLLALPLASAVAQPTATAAADAEAARLTLPDIALQARDIALVVNDADPSSVEIGRYYAKQRGIADAHVIHVSFTPARDAMTFAEFERVQAVLDAKVGPEVQAYALAWTLPFRVECMSVTAAFAFGFDPPSYCAEGCVTTKLSPYFNSASHAPYTDHRLRPAMLLAGSDVASVKRLIDRGLRSDGSWPEGKAYLLNTSDGARNVRAETFARVRSVLGPAYPVEQVDADTLENRPDVMFYFTGFARIAGIASNHYLDGAVADHLTSFGGLLSGSGQTNALEFLQAGATGSYGTAVEPCAFRAKFPEVGVVMSRYLGGETLIEAYWKSVRMPGQGVFIGDPLARPFGGVRLTRTSRGTTITTRALPPGRYVMEAARGSIGPFLPVGAFTAIGFGTRQINLPAGDPRYFRLRPAPELPKAASELPKAASEPEKAAS